MSENIQDNKWYRKQTMEFSKQLSKGGEINFDPYDRKKYQLANKGGYVMSETNIEDYKPHKVSEVICINCKNRWIATRPEKTLLKQLECGLCKQVGFVIETGEIV